MAGFRPGWPKNAAALWTHPVAQVLKSTLKEAEDL